jgi:hypothetical protein
MITDIPLYVFLVRFRSLSLLSLERPKDPPYVLYNQLLAYGYRVISSIHVLWLTLCMIFSAFPFVIRIVPTLQAMKNVGVTADIRTVLL